MRKKKRKLYALHVLSNNENTVLSDQPVAADDTVFPDQPVTADTPSSIDQVHARAMMTFNQREAVVTTCDRFSFRSLTYKSHFIQISVS